MTQHFICVDVAMQNFFSDTGAVRILLCGLRQLMMNDQRNTAAPDGTVHGPITIKKYANRRLYNTATSCYVTLDYLAQLVKAGAEFAVFDAKTGEDITRSVLTHIIVEEEAKGQSMLPVSFLRHLISFYGDSLQVMVPRYLEDSMQSFARNQEQMRSYLRGAFDGLIPFSAPFEEMSKQQLAIFEQAMRMFSPFYGGESTAASERAADSTAARPEPAGKQIEELRNQLNTIQHRLDALVGRSDEEKR
jgi:polyhydroxyalkanoate synthesis repressor PhaR